MVSYLLLPAVILCVVISQPANITGTEKPKNETSFYKDELKAIENELEKNNTFLVISEDNENFQDQKNEFLHQHCHQDLLINLSHVYCGEPFHAEMHNIHADEWCVLKSIIRYLF
ncbi:hypothetical protein GOODEAATRI_015808 [Goodea atripinnis]|uniref:Uncharacterized protein n=1 Tax=Goodea atripinnis TaxID=208336 RepID=A0ABV0NUW1_9TELE